MLVNRVHKPYLCKICKKGTGVKVCKCQKAFYCSRNCQKIDWNVHKTDCCYKITDHHTIISEAHASRAQQTHVDRKIITSNNCADPNYFENNNNNNRNNNNNNNDGEEEEKIFLQRQQQYHNSDITTYSNNLQQTHRSGVGSNISNHIVALNRGRREYDPTPLQYQQQPHVTYTDDVLTHTTTLGQSSSSSTSAAVDDFEENLFNSLMYSVVNDESAEQEILKNLNIRADDLLSTYTLDSDISATLSAQALKEYVPHSETDDQTLSDKIFDQIQCQENFESRPETQKLLKETKETLEKELSLFRESNLHEIDTATMQLGSTNPKYVTHTKVQDNFSMR